MKMGKYTSTAAHNPEFGWRTSVMVIYVAPIITHFPNLSISAYGFGDMEEGNHIPPPTHDPQKQKEEKKQLTIPKSTRWRTKRIFIQIPQDKNSINWIIHVSSILFD